jgi:hypothetical protein
MKVALQLWVGHTQKFTLCAEPAKLLVHQLSTPHLNLARILVEPAPAPKPSSTQAFNVLLWE